jgi:molecular chaperone GrpE
MKKTAVENQATAPVAEAECLLPVEPVPLTAQQIEDLKQRAAKADENWDRLLRATADFENYKKRGQREKQEAIKYANESLLERLIPVLDTFDRAMAATQNGDAPAIQSLQAGITMVHQQLKSVLADAGLEEVDASDKPFDPNAHEAVSQKESVEVPEGTVVQQLRKGYKLSGRLLRPASVIVSHRPAVS